MWMRLHERARKLLCGVPEGPIQKSKMSQHMSWTKLNDYAGVPPGERQRAAVGLLNAPQLSANLLEFIPVSGLLPCAFGSGDGF